MPNEPVTRKFLNRTEAGDYPRPPGGDRRHAMAAYRLVKEHLDATFPKRKEQARAQSLSAIKTFCNVLYRRHRRHRRQISSKLLFIKKITGGAAEFG